MSEEEPSDSETSEETAETLAAKQRTVRRHIPAEETFELNDSASRLHGTLTERTPKLRLQESLAKPRGPVRLALAVVALCALSATVVSLIGWGPYQLIMGGWPDVQQSFGTSLPVHVVDIPLLFMGMLTLGAVAAQKHPLYDPALRCKAKAGTLIGCTADGKLTEAIFVEEASLRSVATKIKAAVGHTMHCPQAEVSYADLMGCDPEAVEDGDLYYAELEISASEYVDLYCQGEPTDQTITAADNLLPLDLLEVALLNAEVPALVQTVVQPRLRQPKRLDHYGELLRSKRSTNPGKRFLNRWFDQLEFAPPEELTEAQNHRLKSLARTEGNYLFAATVRVTFLARTPEERARGEQLLADVEDHFGVVADKYVSLDSTWDDETDAALTNREILQRFDEAQIEHASGSLWWVTGDGSRTNLLIDANEAWSLLLTPGDGNPRTRDARDTVSPEQTQSQQPNHDQREQLRYEGKRTDGDDLDDDFPW